MAATDPQDITPTGNVSRLQLYVRLGFGALVAFGLAGGLTGHKMGAVIVYVVVAVVWCLARIVAEALEAWALLHPPAPPNNRPPDPPAAPAVTPPVTG